MEKIKALFVMAWCIYKLIGMWYLSLFFAVLFRYQENDPIDLIMGEDYVMQHDIVYYFKMMCWFNLDYVIFICLGMLGVNIINSFMD